MKNNPNLSPHRATGVVFFVAMLFAVFCLPYDMKAQTCDTEADFSFTVSGCDVDFLPLYSGPGPVLHLWEFYNNSTPTGSFSSSTVALAHFTFDYAGGTTKYVRHVITLPGGVVKICEKQVSTSCDENDKCNSAYYFYYQVSGCSITITHLNTPGSPTVVWDFGDGSPTVTTSTLPTHTYTASGTYTIVISIAGKPCTMVIKVDCDEPPCCSAEFSADITNDCGILRLRLMPACTEDGTHKWSITSTTTGACITILNFNPTAVSPDVVLTGINTSLLPSLIINHLFACSDGTVTSQSSTVSFATFDSPTNPTIGIFIGEELTTKPLTTYNCVLPGSGITSAIPVFVSGIITMDKTFTFTNTAIEFHRGMTGFDVASASAGLQLSGCTLSAAPGCTCLWRGIDVTAAGALRCNMGTFISDALYAINIHGGTATISVNVDEVHFTRDYVGIRGTGILGLNTLTRTVFDGVGGANPLLDICELAPLNDLRAPTFFGNAITQAILSVGYQTERGFAGMYLDQVTGLFTMGTSLPPRNMFMNLAYGIMIYDSDFRMTRNSIFTNIAAGAYLAKRTAGIFFDDILAGSNSFTFIGLAPSTPDFINCEQGMQIRSEQAAPTTISIGRAFMDGVRTGIFLDARYSGGSFTGTVSGNRINSNLTIPQFCINAGIGSIDLETTASHVVISGNEINMGNTLVPMSGGSTGIAVDGLSPASDPGAGIVEADVHDNRVTLQNGAQVGIGAGYHPNAWIRNNNGGTITAGNGVFILDSNTSWAGVSSELGNNNMLACNQVTVDPSASVTKGLLRVNGSMNSQFLQNIMEGAGDGARFEMNDLGTDFRCNTMMNNTIGLNYANTAVTGDQGMMPIVGPPADPGLSYGNLWLGTFGPVSATTDFSVMFGSSPYYVRNIVGEVPPTAVVPGIGWFTVISPTAPVDCILNACPAPSPAEFMPSARLTAFDNLIAQGIAVSGDDPHAEGMEWQHAYNLLRKLKDHPDLVENNLMMQNFLAGLSGSNIEALWNVQIDARNTIAPDANTLVTMQSNMSAILGTENEIWLLDSLMNVTTDANEIAALLGQIETKRDLLNVQVLAQETVCGTFGLQRTAAIASLVEQLSAITPQNISESNLRRSYEIYYQTVASGLNPGEDLLAELEDIAMQCPLEGGPGVYMAASLYKAITGILPDQSNCEENANRGKQKTGDTQVLSISPNPNQGSFVVNIPETLPDEHALLRIQDARGGVIKNILANGARTINFDLADQPNGVYFVSLLGSGRMVKALPFIIQH